MAGRVYNAKHGGLSTHAEPTHAQPHPQHADHRPAMSSPMGAHNHAPILPGMHQSTMARTGSESGSSASAGNPILPGMQRSSRPRGSDAGGDAAVFAIERFARRWEAELLPALEAFSICARALTHARAHKRMATGAVAALDCKEPARRASPDQHVLRASRTHRCLDA